MQELEDDPSQVYTPKPITPVFDWYEWRNKNHCIFIARTGEDGEVSSWKALIKQHGAEKVTAAVGKLKVELPKGGKVFFKDVLALFNNEDSDESKSGSAQHWILDKACWRNYCKELIYAAAFSPLLYRLEIEKRRNNMSSSMMTTTLLNGEKLHKWLNESFTGPPLVKAMTACGDNINDKEGRLRFKATVICCREFLPVFKGAMNAPTV
jgi:hypothetical protein